MRKILNYISFLLLLVCSLTVSCSGDIAEEGQTPGFSENEGALKVSWGLDATTKSAVTRSLATKSSVTSSTLTEEDIAKLMESSVLKIYDSNDNLIRRYEPANNIPSEVYLAVGNYKATVTAGDKVVYATFDPSELLYKCEKEFEIKAGEYSNVALECTMIHAAVRVIFNSSLKKNYDKGFDAYVSSSDVFDFESIESVPTLTYFGNHTNGIGYFLLTDDNKSFSWGFKGESSNPKIGEQSLTGVIGYPISRGLYTLSFRFNDTPDGYGEITVEVDESMDEDEDDFVFVVQPTIEGDNSGIESAVDFIGDDLTYDVESSLADISLVSVDGVEIYNKETATTNTDGIIYTPNGKTGVITISNDYFTKFGTTGTKNILISVEDIRGGTATATASVNVSGMESVTKDSYDLWKNSATLNAKVYLKDAASIKIAYREKGETEWIENVATKSGENYSIDIEPTWNEGTNDNTTTPTKVYKLDKGIFAGKTYEYKMIVDDKSYGISEFKTAAGHTIPYGDMESSSLPCWGEDHGNSESWGSGNNTANVLITVTTTLCKQSTHSGMGGSSCAYLDGGETFNNLTAGNIFFGNFNLDGTSGTVGFGQKFSWESRPKTFKLKYAAKMGTVNYTKYGSFIANGSPDKGRIFLAIVDWTARHGVTAGTDKPVGSWDPATSTDGGKIIGYASIFVEGTVDPMREIEIPINYYDKIRKPTSGNYSIVISCSTSAYGEYMNGSSDSEMWVDDFKLGY